MSEEFYPTSKSRCLYDLFSAPIYDVVIDDKVNYTVGEELLVNCSSYSAQDIYHVSIEAYFQIEMNSVPLNAVEFGDVNANCAVGLFWAFSITNSTQIAMSHATILCKLENTLRNITRTAEKVIIVT